MPHNHDIIVIGASAGGIETISRLLAQLPKELPAAVCIVQHLSAASPGVLADIFNKTSSLPVVLAENDMALANGQVYVAPADQHLLVKRGFLSCVMGPKENRSRPAIDPLFRSAAAHYSSRVIGIVLTGLLDDGTAGLLAIRRCNGITVIQQPSDALYPDMPENALAHLNPDYCLAVAEMGTLLTRLVDEPAKAPVPMVPEDIWLEIKIAENVTSAIDTDNVLGHQVEFACPSCGGFLWEMETDSMSRYRCHVGHGFSQRALVEEQDEALEKTLWMALRSLEEKAKLQTQLARQAYNRSPQGKLALQYERDAATSHQHAEQLRQLLLYRPRKD